MCGFTDLERRSQRKSKHSDTWLDHQSGKRKRALSLSGWYAHRRDVPILIGLMLHGFQIAYGKLF